MADDITMKRQKLLKKVGQGTTSEDKGVVVSPHERMPYRPEYLHMSKKDVIAAEKKRMEDDAKIKAYRQQLAGSKAEEVKEEMPVEKPKKGRPKKIE
jgi:predicted RNA-binding protein YlxR (DUF448 family)